MKTVGARLDDLEAFQADVAGLQGRRTPQSGRYTPTLSTVANLDSATPHEARWIRSGDVIDVKMRLEADPTSNTTLTQLGISLPVSSHFSSEDDLTGAGAIRTGAGGAAVYADTTEHRAVMEWTSTQTANASWYVNFSYRLR